MSFIAFLTLNIMFFFFDFEMVFKLESCGQFIFRLTIIMIMIVNLIYLFSISSLVLITIEPSK